MKDKRVSKYEKDLHDYAEEKLKSLNYVTIYGNHKNKGAIITFNLSDIHASDIAMVLDQDNIAIRTGHHCAQPLMKKLNVNSTARLSFGIYNNKKDVDCFVESLIKTYKFFK